MCTWRSEVEVELYIKLDPTCIGKWRREVDGCGWGSCPETVFDVSGVEYSESVTRGRISECVFLRWQTGCNTTSYCIMQVWQKTAVVKLNPVLVVNPVLAWTGNIPGTHFCKRLSRPQGHSAVGRIMSMKSSNDTIGNRTRDLPACSAVPQPTAPPAVAQASVPTYRAMTAERGKLPRYKQQYVSDACETSFQRQYRFQRFRRR
jgi:hypothetical protein